MAAFSYVALVTPAEGRAVHMAIGEGVILIGALLGNTLNAAFVDNLGLDKVAYISAAISILPCLVIVLLVVDSASVKSLNEKWKWTEILGLTNLLSAFRCILKKRPGQGRKLLILTFILYAGPFVSSIGFSSNAFLYFTKERGMTLSDYSTFLVFEEAMKGLGGGIVLFLLAKFVEMEFFNLLIISCAIEILGYVSISLPFYPVCVWVGAIFFIGHSIVLALVRSLQAELCDKNELGMMFAFDSIYMVTINNFASIGFHAMYSASFQVWPEMTFAVCALILILSMVVIIFVSILKDRHDSITCQDTNNK